MSRTPIQVPVELRDRMNELQSQFRVNTHPALILKLIRTAEDFESYKERQSKAYEERMISFEEDSTKQQYSDFVEKMGFNSVDDAFLFLLHNYETAENISRSAFDYYRMLQMKKL